VELTVRNYRFFLLYSEQSEAGIFLKANYGGAEQFSPKYINLENKIGQELLFKIICSSDNFESFIVFKLRLVLVIFPK
jgi:hypothetical protein